MLLDTVLHIIRQIELAYPALLVHNTHKGRFVCQLPNRASSTPEHLTNGKYMCPTTTATYHKQVLCPEDSGHIPLVVGTALHLGR
jgi:hypothetical protein